MLLTIHLAILALILLLLLSALIVHFRSQVRLKLSRQLAGHATVFAPYNLLMYAFSAVPAGAFPDRKRFREVDPLQDNWQTIHNEAAGLFGQSPNHAALPASIRSSRKAGSAFT